MQKYTLLNNLSTNHLQALVQVNRTLTLIYGEALATNGFIW
jgi:hypothetical protein